MDSSIQLNQLNPHNNEQNGLVTLISRLEQCEHYDVVVVFAFTLMIIAAVSIFMHRLQSKRRANHFRPSDQDTQTNSLVIYGKDGSPKKENLDIEATVERLRSELQEAADKCYIRECAIQCMDIVHLCPHLVNVKCRSTGLTPFHLVCFHGEAPLVEYMLNMGADPHLTSDRGESPICLAVYAVLFKNRYAKAMFCLDILHRAGSTLDENGIWYDLLVKKALSSGKTAVIKWLKKIRKPPKSPATKSTSF